MEGIDVRTKSNVQGDADQDRIECALRGNCCHFLLVLAGRSGAIETENPGLVGYSGRGVPGLCVCLQAETSQGSATECANGESCGSQEADASADRGKEQL